MANSNPHFASGRVCPWRIEASAPYLYRRPGETPGTHNY